METITPEQLGLTFTSLFGRELEDDDLPHPIAALRDVGVTEFLEELWDPDEFDGARFWRLGQTLRKLVGPLPTITWPGAKVRAENSAVVGNLRIAGSLDVDYVILQVLGDLNVEHVDIGPKAKLIVFGDLRAESLSSLDGYVFVGGDLIVKGAVALRQDSMLAVWGSADVDVLLDESEGNLLAYNQDDTDLLTGRAECVRARLRFMSLGSDVTAKQLAECGLNVECFRDEHGFVDTMAIAAALTD